MSHFTQQMSFEMRAEEARRILSKYPNRVPVRCGSGLCSAEGPETPHAESTVRFFRSRSSRLPLAVKIQHFFE